MLEKILIVAIFTYGYCIAFTEGNIFETIGKWAENNLPEKLWKPLGGCSVCTAFWVGTLMYWIFWGNVWTDWLIISVGAVGFNGILVNLINKIEDISDAIDPPKDE